MNHPEKVVIGTRKSRLALIQSSIVADYLRENFPDMEVSLLSTTTTGDRIQDKSLDKIGGKGLFVKELDRALLEGKSDLSVHSLKDMPFDEPEGLCTFAYSKREDARDVLVLPEGKSRIDLSKPIGVSSLRRLIQVSAIYPEAEFDSIRGNVPTRIEKLDSGRYGALILAAAGLIRLGLEERISRYFEADEVIPCAGQGILAVQGRSSDDLSYLEGFDDKASRAAAFAERSFVKTLGGGCFFPAAAYAEVKNDSLTLSGLYFSEQKKKYITGQAKGKVSEAKDIGPDLACRLKKELDG